MVTQNPRAKKRRLTRGEVARRHEVEQEWPKLSRYYGLTPAEISHMPRWLRKVYIAELPKLQAREQLAAAEASLLPHMKQSDQREVLRRLSRLADFPKQPAAKPSSKEELVASLAGMGIAVEEQS